MGTRINKIYKMRDDLILQLGASVRQIDRHWIAAGKLIDILNNVKVKGYLQETGLYRAKIDGEVKYIGCAGRSTSGGLRVRLRDYLNGRSCRYESGRKMHENRAIIDIELLPLGDYPFASYAARALECWLIFKYRKTVWNKISVADREEIELDPNLSIN